MAKTYDAGVKEYRETYWMPDYTPKETDILACFKVTPQPGVPREEVAAAVADERLTVGPFDPDLGAAFHGIRLSGAPLKGSTPPIDIWIIDSIASGVRITQLTEIFSGSPAANQYRVDYGETALGFVSGMIWMNVPDATPVSCDYFTTGSPLSAENINQVVNDAAASFKAAESVVFALKQSQNVCPLELSVINQQTPWTKPVIPFKQDHPEEIKKK